MDPENDEAPSASDPPAPSEFKTYEAQFEAQLPTNRTQRRARQRENIEDDKNEGASAQVEGDASVSQVRAGNRNVGEDMEPITASNRPWWATSSRTRNLTTAQLNKLIKDQATQDNIVKPKGYSVSFHYNPEVESFHFGRSHPMKPWRLQLTKQLVVAYGLTSVMKMQKAQPATQEEIKLFHEAGYLEFLHTITPKNKNKYTVEQTNYNFGEDCPVFDGLYEYCSLYTGATVDGARALTRNASDIAINWSGGLHHAKKASASGFCYVNDIVLGILELLRVHQRVLYIDIDVHHGDGVEEAFWSSNRVLTLSFHKYGDGFFPGTGGYDDQGPTSIESPGFRHSLNVPLKDGIEDAQYLDLFRKLVDEACHKFQPGAIVLQCGADSLGGDRLGKFNLNINAHGECVSHVKSKNIPLLVLGGGGYTARNVARLWTHETAVLVGAKLSNELPRHIPYRQAFEGPENGAGKLYPKLSSALPHHNNNSLEYLQSVYKQVSLHLRYLEGAPSVQMHHPPADVLLLRDELEAERQERKQRRQLEENGNGGHGELV